MACTCIKESNKNAIDRLNPTIVDGEKHYLVFIRGNRTNPLGILNKLFKYGAIAGTTYTTNDLMNVHNLFYIDYNNMKQVAFISDEDILAKAIESCWTELFISSDADYSPIDWDSAIIDWPSAQLYESGKDDITNAELKIVGRLKVLRDIYRKGWVPTCNEAYYYIGVRNDKLDKGKGSSWMRFLSFGDSETRDTFFDTYKDMIESVKSYI